MGKASSEHNPKDKGKCTRGSQTAIDMRICLSRRTIQSWLPTRGAYTVLYWELYINDAGFVDGERPFIRAGNVLRWFGTVGSHWHEARHYGGSGCLASIGQTGAQCQREFSIYYSEKNSVNNTDVVLTTFGLYIKDVLRSD